MPKTKKPVTRDVINRAVLRAKKAAIALSWKGSRPKDEFAGIEQEAAEANLQLGWKLDDLFSELETLRKIQKLES